MKTHRKCTWFKCENYVVFHGRLKPDEVKKDGNLDVCCKCEMPAGEWSWLEDGGVLKALREFGSVVCILVGLYFSSIAGDGILGGFVMGFGLLLALCDRRGP